MSQQLLEVIEDLRDVLKKFDDIREQESQLEREPSGDQEDVNETDRVTTAHYDIDAVIINRFDHKFKRVVSDQRDRQLLRSSTSKKVIPIKCSKCEKEFLTLKALSDHKNTTHFKVNAVVKKDSRIYKCEECGRNCRHITGLREHIIF